MAFFISLNACRFYFLQIKHQTMKYIFTFLFLSVHLLSFSQKGNEVTIKVRHTPNTTYNQMIRLTSDMKMLYTGSPEFLENIKNKGVDNPMVVSTVRDTELRTVTGALSNDNTFPLTMEFVSSKSGDGKKIIPDGTIIYGRGFPDKLPVLDSIASNGLEESLKNIILTTSQSLFSQLKMPEKTLRVGESFSIDNPITIPIASLTMDMMITTTYKLLNIKKGIAEFDMTLVYKLKGEMEDYPISATGAGTGKMFYNVKHSFYDKYEIVSEMTMQMKQDNFGLDLTTKTSHTMTNVITKN